MHEPIYENVPVIPIAADRREDHRNALGAEEPARRYPSGIVVDPTDRTSQPINLHWPKPSEREQNVSYSVRGGNDLTGIFCASS